MLLFNYFGFDCMFDFTIMEGEKKERKEKKTWSANFDMILLFHVGGPYHIETSPLICSANQWADFCMIETSVMKELMVE